MALNKNIEKRILWDLWNNKDGIYVYKIPSVYGIRVSDVFPFIRRFHKWVEYKDGKIRLFDYARAAVRANINRKSSVISRNDARSHIPLQFEGPKINIEDFVLPKSFMCGNRKK